MAHFAKLDSDNKVVTLHDNNLLRVSGLNKSINNVTFKEIKNIDLFNGGTIAELSTLLESFPEVKFNIDFKNWDTLIPTLNLLDFHKAYDRVCLASFKSPILWKAKSLRPNACISMGVFDTFIFTSLTPYSISVKPNSCK